MTNEEARKLLNKFTHKDLIPFAQKKFKIKNTNNFKTKKELVNYIAESFAEKKLRRILQPSNFEKWWDIYNPHVYGTLTIIGVVLAVIPIVFNNNTPENEIVIMGKVVNAGLPSISADISLPQLNMMPVKTGNFGNFNFPPISEEKLPSDSINIRIKSENFETTVVFPISKKDYFDNLVIDVAGNEIIVFDPAKFSILILPFQLLNDCSSRNIGIEKTISTRLNDLAELEGLALETQVLFSGMGCPKSYTEAKKIGERYNANMVVWGDLFEECYSDSLNSCLKYIITQTPIKKINEKGKTSISRHTLDAISRGKLQNDIDYIIYYSLALEANNRKEHNLAVQYCNKILNEIAPKEASVYVTLGYSYYQLKDTLNAELSFKKAIELDSLAGGAYINMANFYDNEGNRKLSRQYHKKAIELEYENPLAHANYGFHLMRAKDFIEAEKEFTEALRIDSNYTSGYVGLGNLSYFSKRDNQSALKFYKKALMINPEYNMNHIVRHNIGMMYYKLNYLDSAEYYIGINIELNPDFAGSYFTLGQINMDRGLVENAQQLYLKSCELIPEWRQPRFDSLFQMDGT